jgi:hypothetical protein
VLTLTGAAGATTGAAAGAAAGDSPPTSDAGDAGTSRGAGSGSKPRRPEDLWNICVLQACGVDETRRQQRGKNCGDTVRPPSHQVGHQFWHRSVVLISAHPMADAGSDGDAPRGSSPGTGAGSHTLDPLPIRRSATSATSASAAAKLDSRPAVRTTQLPSVANDFTTLELERRKLVGELEVLNATTAQVAERYKRATEAHVKQLESLGKYDRFFMHDKGCHPLGRRNAVLGTKATVAKYLQQFEVAKGRAVAKCNTAMDANAEVRRRIDVLRRESVVFRELFVKMEVCCAGAWCGAALGQQ